MKENQNLALIKFPINMAFEDEYEGAYLAQILTKITGRKVTADRIEEPGPTTRTFYQFVFNL